MRSLTCLAFVAVSLLATAPAGARCFDVSKGEPASLTGRLYHAIAPGPPGFRDVTRGDTPEPIFVLRLARPICLTGDDFADPKLSFSEAQLVPEDETAKAMHDMVDNDVSVTLTQSMAAQTGHHHRPLVAWVTAIAPVAAAPVEDLTQEYGTAATSVRGFYAALAEGMGAEAALFIVPERRSGPFAASAMSRFYGHLVEPLELLSLVSEAPDTYLARYHFRSASGECNGSARVRTVNRGGSNLIFSIQALNGC